MTARMLSGPQVALLLVSASYGIGFLFGSGEAAVEHGMAGGIYGLATGAGMLLLALLAPKLWHLRISIWRLFGARFGHSLGVLVAAMSVVWMAGGLAAQMQGSVAVLALMSVTPKWAWLVVLGCCLVASRLRLQVASTVFAVLLLVSTAFLVYTLVRHDGVQLYLQSPTRFLADASSYRPDAFLIIVVAVAVLVCMGGDYHQFIQSARHPRSAQWGCAVAGVVLLLLSFLPPAVVLSLQAAGPLPKVGDARHVIPLAVSRSVSGILPGLDVLALTVLLGAALGSAAALLRMMGQALAGATAWVGRTPPGVLDLLALLAAALLAAGGQGIVATMVSANVVYIGSIGPVLLALVAGERPSSERVKISVGAGFVVATAAQFIARSVELSLDADLVSLATGVAAAALPIAFDRNRGSVEEMKLTRCWRHSHKRKHDDGLCQRSICHQRQH